MQISWPEENLMDNVENSMRHRTLSIEFHSTQTLHEIMMQRILLGSAMKAYNPA
jgi:hypothetical protein